jgi:hypothetical protein
MNPVLRNPSLLRAHRAVAGAFGSATLACALACTLASGVVTPAQAHRNDAASSFSALSALPLAVSVAMPVMVFAAGASLVVKGVELSAQGTVLVLERASDGVRASVVLAGHAVEGLALVAGTVVLVSAVGAGWVLYAGSKAVAFVPNEIGKALTYNERVTR